MNAAGSAWTQTASMNCFEWVVLDIEDFPDKTVSRYLFSFTTRAELAIAEVKQNQETVDGSIRETVLCRKTCHGANTGMTRARL